MKKFLKITLITILTILAVALLAPMFLTGKISEIVKREANNMLTAKLDFEELDISLIRHFPNASVSLDNLTIVSGVEPFVGDTIVAADRISIVVNLASIFKESGFEVKRILLDKPYIHGEKSAAGEVNWDIMKVAEESAESAESEPTEESEKSEPSAFRLALKDVSIEDAELHYDDDSTKMHAAISPLNLTLSGDFSAAQSQLKLNTLAQNVLFEAEGMKIANGVEMELNADINADLERDLFILNDNTFRINAIEMRLDGHASLMEQGVEVDLKLDSNDVKFRDVLSLVPMFYTNQFKDLKADGELKLAAWAKGIMAQGSLPAFEITLDVKDGMFRYSSLPKSVTDINISAKLENGGGTVDATRLDIPNFGLKMGGNSLKATLSASTHVSDLQFATTAAGKLNLGAIKEVYPLADTISLKGVITADISLGGRLSHLTSKQLDRMHASGTLSIDDVNLRLKGMPEIDVYRITTSVSPSALTLGECRIKVGVSDISANGQLSNYLGWALRDDVLGGRLYINSTLLDMNELMRLTGSDTSTQTTPSEEPTSEDAPTSTTSSLKIPKNLDLVMQTSLKRVLFQKMEISDFVGNITVKDGVASLSKLVMNALGGSLSASGSYGTITKSEKPQLLLNAEVKEASFARTFQELEFIQRLIPIFEKTGGNFSMKFDMTGSINEDMSIDYPTLNASGEVSSKNIQLANVPIFNALSSKLNTSSLQQSLEGKLIVIEFSVNKGHITTKPFDLQFGSTKVNLSGTTGLDQSIDYIAKVTMPKENSKMLQTLNVNIGGTFSKPQITVDIESATKEILGNLISSRIEQLAGDKSGQEDETTEEGSDDTDTEESSVDEAERMREDARKAGDKLIQEAERRRDEMIAAAESPIAKAAAKAAGDLLVKTAREQAKGLADRTEAEIARRQNK